METSYLRLQWVYNEDEEDLVSTLCRGRGHSRISKGIALKMFAYVLLVLCAAQLFDLPQVSSYTYQKCAQWWVKHGCRIDYHRSMTALFDDRRADSNVTIDWDNFDGYVYDLACRCRAAARNAGNEWFALENYGVCFSAAGNISSYLSQYPLDPNERCVGVFINNNTIVSQIDGEICVGGYFRAYFYEITNLGAAAPAAAPGGGEEEIIRCNAVSDVAFVVDVSGSVGNDNFKLILEFLQMFLNAYDFSAGNSRLGLITFDENCHVGLNWMDSSGMTVAQIRDIINGLEYTAGSTRTDKALNCTRDIIIKPNERQNVPKTVIVMTDGQSWNGINLLPGPSGELRGMGCKMLAIGIGNEVDPQELQVITGFSDQIFLLQSFQNLIEHAANHVNKLLAKACIS